MDHSENHPIEGQTYHGFDGVIHGADHTIWNPAPITSKFLSDLDESGSNLTEQLNRLESELARDDRKTDVLKAQLQDLKCMLKNGIADSTDTTITAKSKCENLKAALEKSSKQLKELDQRDVAIVKPPSNILRRICGKIIEKGIDDLDVEELKFMHEEVYCAAHRINDSLPGGQITSELASLVKRIEGLKREIQLVQHLVSCREPKN